jgi:hypothetical protein
MTEQRAGRVAKTNKWLRWTIGAAVGVAVGLGGVAIYNSGDTYRCDFAISDTESQRRWGLSYAAEICDRGDRGLPLPPLDYGGETPGWEHVGNGWGVLVAVLGFGVLTWLVPISIGRLQPPARPPRPPRPAPLSPGGKVWWSEDRASWRTTASQASGLHVWAYDPQEHAWTRGEKAPTTGATRSETWALRRDELLREQNRLIEAQNRLLAGLPPLPPEPTVLPASGPRPEAGR